MREASYIRLGSSVKSKKWPDRLASGVGNRPADILSKLPCYAGEYVVQNRKIYILNIYDHRSALSEFQFENLSSSNLKFQTSKANGSS